MAEDYARIKSTKTFKKFYNSKWSELVSHGALTTLHEGHFNKPSTLPFTEVVQRRRLNQQKSMENCADRLLPKLFCSIEGMEEKLQGCT